MNLGLEVTSGAAGDNGGLTSLRKVRGAGLGPGTAG